MIVDRRVSSLFTTSVVLVLVSVLLFVALLNGARDLIILCLLIFVIIGGLKLWTRLSPAAIRCNPSLDKDRVFAGDDLAIRVHSENGKFLPVWLAVEAPLKGPRHSSQIEASLTAERSLLWYQVTRFQWTYTAKQRGIHTIGPLRVSSGDLFGFFVKESKNSGELQAIVYPRLVPIGQLSLPKRDFFGVPGGESPVDDPVYILGTADYHHGRPAKYIHWKASARHDRLQEKLFESTEQEKILIAVDVEQFAQASAYDAFERTIEVVASLAAKLDRHGCALGLLANGVMTGGTSPIVPITRSPRQVPAILEALARLQMEPFGSLVDMLRSTVEIPSGTSCIYVALQKEHTTDMVREHLKRRRVPVTFLTFKEACGLRRDGYIGDADTPLPEDTSFSEVQVG